MFDQLVYLVQEALILVLLLSAPPVLASFIVGIATSAFQATTQLQDTSIGAVPRLIAVYGSLAVTAPWIGAQVVAFTQTVFDLIVTVG